MNKGFAVCLLVSRSLQSLALAFVSRLCSCPDRLLLESERERETHAHIHQHMEHIYDA